MIIWIILLSVVLVLSGIPILRGKCDGLIAGYNTLSPENQGKYNVVRLRLIVACFLFALAALNFLFLLKTDLAADVFICCVVVLSITAVVLGNTWAKKRKK